MTTQATTAQRIKYHLAKNNVKTSGTVGIDNDGDIVIGFNKLLCNEIWHYAYIQDLVSKYVVSKTEIY